MCALRKDVTHRKRRCRRISAKVRDNVQADEHGDIPDIGQTNNDFDLRVGDVGTMLADLDQQNRPVVVDKEPP